MLRLFSQWREKWDAESRLELLRARLDEPVEARNTAALLPAVVPANFEADWLGPVEPIGNLPFVTIWGVVGESNTIVYVSHEQAAYWEGRGLDWRALAMHNLRNASIPGANGEKLDDEGRPFVKVMLQPDALGPSRLLLPQLFEDELGPDYLVAIPERTCAIAFRRKFTPVQQSDIDHMIDGCFRHGTEPVSPERFSARCFWV